MAKRAWGGASLGGGMGVTGMDGLLLARISVAFLEAFDRLLNFDNAPGRAVKLDAGARPEAVSVTDPATSAWVAATSPMTASNRKDRGPKDDDRAWLTVIDSAAGRTSRMER